MKDQGRAGSVGKTLSVYHACVVLASHKVIQEGQPWFTEVWLHMFTEIWFTEIWFTEIWFTEIWFTEICCVFQSSCMVLGVNRWS